MSLSIRLLTPALALALLSGCAAVGPDFTAPPTVAAQGFTAPGEALPAQVKVGQEPANDWWMMFGSSDIDAMVKLATASNPSLQAARARLAEARETVLSQPGQLQGDIHAGASREHVNLAGFGFSGFGDVKLSNPTVNLYTVGASAKYDFDLWGAHRRDREYRQAEAETAAEELNAATLTLTGQVVTQCLTIAVVKAELATAENVLSQDRALVEVATKGQQGGSGTQLDIVAARAQLAADQAAIAPLRQQLAVARHALAILVGQPPSEFTPPDFAIDSVKLPASLPIALPSQLARRRPDIRAAEARLRAATARVGVAEAKLYPSITLSGDFAQGSLEPDKIFSPKFSGWSIGPLAVSLPVLDRGALKAQSRAARAATDAAAADYRKTVLGAFGQIADTLQAIRNDDQAVADQEAALKAAQDSVRLNRLRFEGGKSGIQPTLDAQRTLQRVQLAYVRAKAQQYLDAAQLSLATGAGWAGESQVGQR